MTITIIPDDENSASDFWDALDAEYPQVAKDLRVCGRATVSEGDWRAIQQLKGFGDGPDHAPTALLVSK